MQIAPGGWLGLPCCGTMFSTNSTNLPFLLLLIHPCNCLPEDACRNRGKRPCVIVRASGEYVPASTAPFLESINIALIVIARDCMGFCLACFAPLPSNGTERCPCSSAKPTSTT